MKRIFFTLLVVLSTQFVLAQNNSVTVLINGIQALSKYDTSYTKIIQQRQKAIPQLIELLTDTTISRVVDTCFKKDYCRGDLAYLIINAIEPIPFFVVTKIQVDWFDPKYCSWDEERLKLVVQIDRNKFKTEYKKYYLQKHSEIKKKL